jgi:hypothetical protein
MSMNLTEIQNNLIGAWTGNNLLRFMHKDHNELFPDPKNRKTAPRGMNIERV